MSMCGKRRAREKHGPARVDQGKAPGQLARVGPSSWLMSEGRWGEGACKTAPPPTNKAPTQRGASQQNPDPKLESKQANKQASTLASMGRLDSRRTSCWAETGRLRHEQSITTLPMPVLRPRVLVGVSLVCPWCVLHQKYAPLLEAKLLPCIGALTKLSLPVSEPRVSQHWPIATAPAATPLGGSTPRSSS